LHSTDKHGVDCKDILGKFMHVRGRIVKENHKFYSMEGELLVRSNKVLSHLKLTPEPMSPGWKSGGGRGGSDGVEIW
jgi:hypothetical protein